jgi:hypothetical protein
LKEYLFLPFNLVSLATNFFNLRWSEVWDQRFVGSDLTFSIPVKTDGPVETV